MTYRLKLLLHSFIGICLGGLLYVLLRNSTILHAWLRGIGVVGGYFADLQFFADDFFRYYLPDFLWGYSLCLTLLAVFLPQIRGAAGVCAFSASCGAAWELLQKQGAVRGTGDLVDVVLYCAAAIAAFGVYLIIIKERKQT